MKHVVALSGGKDSTAMALRLKQIEPRDYIYVCTPTGNELPEMFEHWKRLGEMLGKPLTPVVGGTLTGLIAQQNALPNWRQRWCTRMLKIEPYAAWLLKQGGEITSYVGLRADEEERAGVVYPGIINRFPMREWGWGINDVFRYLNGLNVVIPKRTDCAWCFFQRIGEWWDLWRDYPEIYAQGEAQEEKIGHTFRSPGKDTWPIGLKELREKFETGHIPTGADLQPNLFNQAKCRECTL
jgi:3'-phosphoadenosine 5'-phosphosulfate sulfotransferase (PAPS reductase)/FAD synthetase